MCGTNRNVRLYDAFSATHESNKINMRARRDEGGLSAASYLASAPNASSPAQTSQLSCEICGQFPTATHEEPPINLHSAGTDPHTRHGCELLPVVMRGFRSAPPKTKAFTRGPSHHTMYSWPCNTATVAKERSGDIGCSSSQTPTSGTNRSTEAWPIPPQT